MLLWKKNSRNGKADSKKRKRTFLPGNQDVFQLKFLPEKNKILVFNLGLTSERAAD